MAHHDFCQNPYCATCEPQAHAAAKAAELEKRVGKMEKQLERGMIPLRVLRRILKRMEPQRGVNGAAHQQFILDQIWTDVKSWQKRKKSK